MLDKYKSIFTRNNLDIFSTILILISLLNCWQLNAPIIQENVSNRPYEWLTYGGGSNDIYRFSGTWAGRIDYRQEYVLGPIRIGTINFYKLSPIDPVYLALIFSLILFSILLSITTIPLSWRLIIFSSIYLIGSFPELLFTLLDDYFGMSLIAFFLIKKDSWFGLIKYSPLLFLYDRGSFIACIFIGLFYKSYLVFLKILSKFSKVQKEFIMFFIKILAISSIFVTKFFSPLQLFRKFSLGIDINIFNKKVVSESAGIAWASFFQYLLTYTPEVFFGLLFWISIPVVAFRPYFEMFIFVGFCKTVGIGRLSSLFSLIFSILLFKNSFEVYF